MRRDENDSAAGMDALIATDKSSSRTARPPAPAGATAKRDPAGTRRRILDAGQSEFAERGYSGAHVGRIAAAARCNIRMIYHYFGSKENLYLAVLDRAYDRIRAHERQLRLEASEPLGGMRQFIEFTFDYLLENPELVALIRNENLLGARFLRNSQVVPQTTQPLIRSIEDLLARGRAAGVFRCQTNAVQLYVSLLSLCFIHVSNRHTLTVMFQSDMADRDWLKERRGHVVQVMLAYVTSGPPVRQGSSPLAPQF